MGAAAVMIAGSACGSSSSQQGQASAPKGTMAQTAPGSRGEARLVTAAADIEAIDQQNRVVTLKTDKGQTFDLKVGPNVDLGRAHVGDRVRAKYYQELVLELRPAQNGSPPSITHRTVQRGGVAERQATITAQVVSVDPERHMVTVRGPRATRTLYVQDPDLQAQLTSIKPHDSITVTFTQAVAMSLEPRM
jgi:hypothetical protein